MAHKFSQFPRKETPSLWLFSLLASVLLGLSGLIVFTHSAQARLSHVQGSKIDPELKEEIDSSDPDDLLDIIIYMEKAADLGSIDQSSNNLEKGHNVVHQLQTIAEESQVDLQAELNRQKEKGSVASYRSIWIVNAIQVEIEAASVELFTTRPDVSRLTLNSKFQMIDPDKAVSSAPSPALPWGTQRIRSDHVIHGLGIDGSGVTIAILDTGVDWNHPLLQANYRGFSREGDAQHEGNWYDVVDGSKTPFDPNGHGTHVTGTAIGSAGIGVAPGANWIAVRILNEFGIGTIADIHLAFQWLLAPAGDPDLSPDLVNNSWAGGPQMTDFLADVAALKAAGIIPIFAAGNTGPNEGSISAPANYPDTIAVGASDDQDELAWFSARGPSKLTGEIKPTFVAPGTHILSSLPNNQYGYFKGTSMATPHAAGLYALLLSADPMLGKNELTALVSNHAKPLNPDPPDHESGWGRIDAYLTVADIVDTGTLRGTIHSNGTPIPGAQITLTTPSGHWLPFLSDDTGNFEAELISGQYTLQSAKFGFTGQAYSDVDINLGQVTNVDIDLPRLPFGVVTGQIREAKKDQAITGIVGIGDVKLEVNSDNEGRYQVELPVGQYQFAAMANGYKISQASVLLEPNNVVVQDFVLEPSQSILLIDSGRWYYDSYIEYFSEALHRNKYAYTLWTVQNPFTDVPTFEDLADFDIVVWSSPFDSPGLVGAGNALSEYLEEGGKLLISGQDLAYFDGAASPEPWFYHQLRAGHAGETTVPVEVAGAEGTPFEGLKFTLNGSDGARNQVSPDKSRTPINSLTQVAFEYSGGSSAALFAHRCEPFRIVYLGFGLEGVGG